MLDKRTNKVATPYVRRLVKTTSVLDRRMHSAYLYMRFRIIKRIKRHKMRNARLEIDDLLNNIRRTLAIEHVIIIGKVNGIKRLSINSNIGNSAPKSQKSTTKVV
jgi:hypothetical protein